MNVVCEIKVVFIEDMGINKIDFFLNEDMIVSFWKMIGSCLCIINTMTGHGHGCGTRGGVPDRGLCSMPTTRWSVASISMGLSSFENRFLLSSINHV